MLSIARAFVENPTLLLDEPTKDLVPVIVEELAEGMNKLRSGDSMAVLLVEQHSGLALDFSDRTVVMNRGRIVYDGESATLRLHPSLLDSLIGVGRSEGRREKDER